MIAVLGATGQMGTAFVDLLGDEALAVARAELDLTQKEAVEAWVRESRPKVVINCAAYTAVDAAETDAQTARRVNTDAVGTLARITAATGAKLVTFSTDYVFDGTKGSPYVESDAAHPLNVYGESKLEGERLAIDLDHAALVVRTSWVLSRTHPNFVRTIIRKLGVGPVSVVDDQIGRPTFVGDLAPAVMEALSAGVTGLLHLTNQGEATWCGLAREVATLAGLDPSRVIPITTAESGRLAVRPADSRLDSERVGPERLTPLADYRSSLKRTVEAMLGGSEKDR
jgi:dTDP-4-dehydrorhamnose reductase